MTEGGRAWASSPHPSAPGSFLSWMGMPESSSRRGSARPRSADADAKLGPGYERRHLRLPSKETRKGPAFWNKPVTVVEQQKLRAMPFRGSGVILPDVDHCMCPRLRKVVYLLVISALTLVFTMMILLLAYITYARRTDSLLLRLGAQDRRLSEAVINTATNQRLQCIPCQKNWLQMANSCYLFSKEKMSWENCIRYCETLHASILIGDTEGEMAFIRMESRNRFTIHSRKLVPAHYWIGLKYNAVKQTWVWADGAYLHIKMSSPDRTSLPTEDACVAFHNGHEDSKKCTYRFYCLCKKKMS